MTPQSSSRTPDEVTHNLRVLAENLQRALGTAAEITRYGPYDSCAELRSKRPRTWPYVEWEDAGDRLEVDLGQSVRWEFDRDSAAVDEVEDLVRSVIAGRVQRIGAPGRACVVVTFADGTYDSRTVMYGPRGCLPLPYWTRWSRQRRGYRAWV